ncbi:MAG: PKD domain-containing protein [Acidobacteriota bacterium]|nr:PKD domain-containing protein [Acidobacteriota bacterium]
MNNLELFVEANEISQAGGSDVTQWVDLSGKNRHLLPVRAGSYPLLTDNAVGGKKSVKWLGNGVAPMGISTPLVIRSGFMVAKINAATFSTFNGLLTTLSNYAILVGGGMNTTTFYDNLYQYYEYRLNDHIYSPLETWAGGNLVKTHTPPAPLNQWGIIYFRFWKNLLADGIQIGSDRLSTIRNLVGEVALLALYSKDFGCESEIRTQMQSLSASYSLPIAEVYPFQGTRGDSVAGGKEVLSDGQIEPVMSVIAASRRTFSANFGNRSIRDIQQERAFFDAKYPHRRFLYRDYNMIPPEDTVVRYRVPQAREFSENYNQSGFAREFVESTAMPDTYITNVAAVALPAANFTMSQSSGTAPLTITFTDLSTGTITGWFWQFGDGTTFTGQNPPAKTFPVGNYVIRLTVSNASGSTFQEQLVGASPQPIAPVSSFTKSASSGVAPLTVSFVSTSTGTSPLTYLWNFGDGTPTSTAASPSHTFASAGNYSVSLTVNNQTNTPNTSTQQVAVSSSTQPTASFTKSPSSGVAPLDVQFTNTSQNATSYFWGFGDGTDSTATSPIHKYTAAGTYFVSLTAYNGANSNTSASQTITVTAPFAGTIRRGGFGVYEHAYTISGYTGNVYENVQVDVTYTAPNGSTIVVGGFHFEATTSTSGVWKSRLAPNMAGTWTYSASIVKNGGTPVIVSDTFTVADNLQAGFIKKNPSNVYGWTTEDGTPFYPIGIGDAVYSRPEESSNKFWMGIDPEGGGRLGSTIPVDAGSANHYLNDVPTYVASYGNGQAGTSAFFNVFRISNSNVHLGLNVLIPASANTGTTNYSVARAKLLDAFILDLRARGFRFIFSVFAIQNAGATYNTATGAPRIENEKFVKYIIDRYGAYVDWWEGMNEPDPTNTAEMAFSTAMAGYLAANDPYDHKVSTGYNPGFAADLANDEYTSPHFYSTEVATTTDTAMKTDIDQYPARNEPIMYSETGNRTANWDATSAVRMRIKLWVSFMRQASLIWWNQTFDKLYTHTVAANQYIGRTERDYVRHHVKWTNGFAAGTKSEPATAPINTFRAYAISSANAFGCYIHHYLDHTATKSGGTINFTPTLTGVLQWFDPATGRVLSTVTISSLANRPAEPIPDFLIDIAFKIVPTAQVFLIDIKRNLGGATYGVQVGSYQKDNNTGGTTYNPAALTTVLPAGAADAAVYNSSRYIAASPNDTFTYTETVLASKTYKIKIHVIEAISRTFTVSANEAALTGLTNWNPHADSGRTSTTTDYAYAKEATFTTGVGVTSIALTFSGAINAQFCGYEIIEQP